MSNTDAEQAAQLASGNTAALLPQQDRTIEQERLHRKQNLAAAFRLFSRFGFDEGVAGHITARDPELTDHFWVNPFGMHFGHIRVSDLLLVRHDGTIVHGDLPLNRAAFAIHSQVHAARPDVISAAHSHSVYGKTWSTLARLLDPITQDACAFYDDHALFDNYSGVVLDLEEGKRIAHRTRRLQGRHSAQSRSADGRSLGGGGGLVVHHHGALLPCAADGRSRRHPGPDRGVDGQAHGGTGGHPLRRLVQLSATLRPDHPGTAGPLRLTPSQSRCPSSTRRTGPR